MLAAGGVIAALVEFYGVQTPPPADLFQFFVWEILSHESRPARRDAAWRALRRLPALTPDAMFRAPAGKLADAVAAAGPHRDERIERLRATTAVFRRHRAALDVEALAVLSPPAAARALRRVAHLDPATRTRALLFSVGHPVLPLDRDLIRVAARLSGGRRARPAVRAWLTARLTPSPDVYREAVVMLRLHARNTCLDVGPHCGVCPLRMSCAFAAAAAS